MNYQKTSLEQPYLKILQNIPNPPEKLYYRGKLPDAIERPKTVAIVGSRRSTGYGEKIAYQLAYELAKNDVYVISGLAYGIDSVAHRACLDAGGVTIAILGTRINKIYPSAHTALAHRILENSAIISEYNEKDMVYPRTSFLQRNRLISGLADIVVIVEASIRSGTFSTASHALNQGKDLFVVPGDITRPNSVGCNSILAQGAQVYTGVDDILKKLFPRRKKRQNNQERQIKNLSKTEQSIIKVISNGESDGEKIIQELNLRSHEFNQSITILEISGMVTSLGCNHWALTF